MKNIVLLLSLIILTSISCQQQRKMHTSTMQNDSAMVNITVNLENYQGVPYDSLIDEISFIRLETNEQCLIGDASQIVCTDSLIFISDRRVSKSIFCFDRQGKFRYKVGAVGQGPGEYAGYYCYITLSPDKEYLVVMDWGKIIYYDYTGKFIKEIMIPQNHALRSIEFIDNNLAGFEFSGNPEIEGKPMVSVYNKQKELVHSAFPTIETESFILSPSYPLRKFGNELYFNFPYSDTFYKVTNDAVSKAYKINFIGGGAPPIEEGMDCSAYSELLDKVIYCEDFTILKDAAVFELRRPIGNGSPFVVYSFKSKKTYNCNMTSNNPLFNFHNIPIARDGDNTLVVPNSPLKLLGIKENMYDSPNIDSNTLSKLYDGLTEDSNPVLFFFHINVD